jgi:DNA helicase-2/ATP-dependent DNA helicase PcrA
MPNDTPENHYRIAYNEALNPSQLEAVTFREGPLLVIAGAGSGKTRTLTYRVARLVEDGIAPEAILLLSFTRKASQEMLQRASRLLDQRCRKVAGGTFHSFANAVLRRHAPLIGFQHSFSILDRSDSETLIGMIRKEITRAASQCTLPRRGTLMNIFSRAVNKSISIEAVVESGYPQLLEQMETIQFIAREYSRRKEALGFMDYDDLLLNLRRLLRDNDDLRRRLSDAHHYVMVDEYQDTNPIQAEIVTFLGQDHRNVMVVGDDSQSIYAFRGANFKNIMTFTEVFPNTHVIKLEENYRSVQPVLDLTNRIIAQAKEKFSKQLFTRRTGGQKPQLVYADDENAQSRFVVEEILNLMNQGVALEQIAVLFRASFHSFDLEIELNRESLPFIKVGGFKFVESAHIKDVLAHLRVMANPQDRLSWYRILTLLANIGPKTADTIYHAVLAEKSGYSGLLRLPLKGKTAASVAPLKALIEDLQSAPRTVFEIGEKVLAYYLPILEEKYDDFPRRKKDLEQLLTLMERYQSPDDLLSDMALEPPNTSRDNTLVSDQAETGRLTLSTVHSAKGLEWHTVFVIWVLDGRFPSIHAMDNPENLEEELRLMYVAATRARENLYLVYPALAFDRASRTYLTRTSRFLEPISEEILQPHAFDW